MHPMGVRDSLSRQCVAGSSMQRLCLEQGSILRSVMVVATLRWRVSRVHYLGLWPFSL